MQRKPCVNGLALIRRALGQACLALRFRQLRTGGAPATGRNDGHRQLSTAPEATGAPVVLSTRWLRMRDWTGLTGHCPTPPAAPY